MKCFIHPKYEATGYCKICKRPVCEKCLKACDGLCPSCARFIHQTIYNYNKKYLWILVIYTILSLMMTYDGIIFFFEIGQSKMQIGEGLFRMLPFIIPFCVCIALYGFKNSIKRQVFGVRDAKEIADGKKNYSFENVLIAILVFIILGAIAPISSIILAFTNIIHVIFMTRDLFYHKKRILNEQKISNL